MTEKQKDRIFNLLATAWIRRHPDLINTARPGSKKEDKVDDRKIQKLD